jgi:hypothetical protein
MFEPSRRHGVYDARWPSATAHALVLLPKAEQADPKESAEAAQTWDTGAGAPTSYPVARLRAA